MNRGADVTRLDALGHTPRDVIKSGHSELYDILTAEVYLEQDAQVQHLSTLIAWAPLADCARAG